MTDHTGADAAAHWEQVYAAKAHDQVSWYEASPDTSVRLVLGDGPVPAKVLDVGAGASMLPDALIEAGVGQVTLIDLSMRALALTQARLDHLANRAPTIVADVLTYPFVDTFDVWHDRAVFHFLTDPADRQRYADQVLQAVAPGGRVVLGTFAADGPTECSGLPVCRYTPAELVAEFEDGFEPTHNERTEHHTPFGTMQPFTWVVLRRR